MLFLLAAVMLLTSCMKPPTRTVVRGDQIAPLPIKIGGAINPAGALSLPTARLSLPSTFAAPPDAASNGTAYYYGGGTLTALDLRNGSVRWRRAVDLVAGTITATPDGVAFAQRYPAPMLYLDAGTGTQRLAMKDTSLAGSVNGVAFAKNNDTFSYFALDAKTGDKLWGTYGGGMQIAGPPQIRSGVLLQLFLDDGAILEDALYAFDPANGHVEWNTFSNTQPLGFRGNVVYVDSTSFRDQLDGYVPLTVSAIDMRTGKTLDEFTYAPDPLENAATYRNSTVKAYVAGGFVYLKVNGTWYRYDADRSEAAAHPSRLEHLDVISAFDGGALLVSDMHHAYIGTSSENALILHPLRGGALASQVVRDSAGASYAVVGPILYRFDRQGNPRAIGVVKCRDVEAILPWAGNLAAMCANGELLFRDDAWVLRQAAATP